MPQPQSDAGLPSTASTVPAPARTSHSLLSVGLLSVTLLALIAANAGSSSARPAQVAAAAASKQSFFYENASLHLTSENGDSIAERGYASGTYNAPVTCTFHISPGHDIKAAYTIYPHGGSVSGQAIAQYVIRGKTGYFGGYMTIKKATGRFRGTSGSKIGFSGMIDKLSFRVTIKVHGWISR